MKIEIINLIYELTRNDPKHIDTFNYKGTYDDIIIYWTYWYISNLPKDDDKFEYLPDKSPLKDSEKQELIPLFSGHYNSSDTHLILFYKYKSHEILVKLKSDKVVNDLNIPFLNFKIYDEKLINKLKTYCKEVKNKINILVFN